MPRSRSSTPFVIIVAHAIIIRSGRRTLHFARGCRQGGNNGHEVEYTHDVEAPIQSSNRIDSLPRRRVRVHDVAPFPCNIAVQPYVRLKLGGVVIITGND